jgi:hypothetical protein
MCNNIYLCMNVFMFVLIIMQNIPIPVNERESVYF